MDDYERQEVLLAFTHRGRQVQLRASAKGWSRMHLKEHPWTDRRHTSRVEYERATLRQGHIAVNSILRDWIKGQVTAIECGILSFEAVFMPHMLPADGRPLIDHVAELLPKPDEPKVIALPSGPSQAAYGQHGGEDLGASVMLGTIVARNFRPAVGIGGNGGNW
jgi:hypothetical protein